MRLLLVINLTYILSRNVSDVLQIIGQIFAFDTGYTIVQDEPLH